MTITGKSVSLILIVCISLVLRSESAVIGTNEKQTDLDQSSARVVHGVPVTDKNEYPFVVDLSQHEVAISSTRFCTGTLITPEIVLTAAHCVLNEGYTSPVYATVGRIELEDKHSNNKHAQTFRTIASMAHPDYAGIGSPNDIAIMLLNQTSDAPTVSLAETSPEKDDVAWVVGYGIQMLGTVEQSAQPIEVLSGRLQKTALRIQERAYCDVPGGQLKTPEGMLCTSGVKEGSSACRGDSGGGLFLQLQGETNREPETIQVGVVSYGDSKCASEESGVFTDVASNVEWVAKSVKKLRKVLYPEKNEAEPQTPVTSQGDDSSSETTQNSEEGKQNSMSLIPILPSTNKSNM
ncbi:Trypsin-like protease [Gracilariopsis chorda]|uniref:Trypsin-like protease n=1 Tax=Gracilariopsis chorda TaxID=448386 RepID=A0A2V3J5D3_9FLOR|nr:Trypsin-like protease [Gracilariopsis chorda]|eukprot:PXF49523.1 Trypsin-like protease [Gracilariopsis chorda]